MTDKRVTLDDNALAVTLDAVQNRLEFLRGQYDTDEKRDEAGALLRAATVLEEAHNEPIKIRLLAKRPGVDYRQSKGLDRRLTVSGMDEARERAKDMLGSLHAIRGAAMRPTGVDIYVRESGRNGRGFYALKEEVT